ncbi:hypothetical protein MLD38_003002 [Melastoma candidum]|uniref:Uncharacterized protein n=1 Tax=Melastoma candidum TaxID=119954 RepID=A0ACB9S5L9_9MYRT|nr:hypothetical protein MLD38_003002 [Melastoma candidum]
MTLAWAYLGLENDGEAVREAARGGSGTGDLSGGWFCSLKIHVESLKSWDLLNGVAELSRTKRCLEALVIFPQNGERFHRCLHFLSVGTGNLIFQLWH